MNNIITIIIIGAYTLIYLIVFFVQKSQLEKIKEINSSMKSYMDIFKIDEVKKYVELKSESTMLDAAKFIANHEKVSKIVDESIEKSVDRIKEVYLEQMGEEHLELISLVIEVIRLQPIDKREEFINNYLPKTKRYFLEILDDINRDDI